MTAQSPVLGVDGVNSAPFGWDDVWKAARDASPTTPCWITSFGGSVSYGQIASDQALLGWPGVVRSLLLARGYAEYAQFWTPNFALAWTDANAWQGPSAPWLIAGSPTQVAGGLCSYPEYASSAAFPLLTFQPKIKCTALDLLYYDTASGTWGYALDAGAAQGVITQATTNLLTKLSFTGLTSGPHFISAGKPSQSSSMRIVGGSAYVNGTGGTGIGFARANSPGMGYTANFGGGAVIPGDGCKVWQGSSGASGPAVGFGFPTQPHLAIFEGALDIGTLNTGIQSGIRVLDRLFQAVRRGRKNCSILYVMPATSGDQSDDDTASFSGRAAWIFWKQAVMALCQVYNAAYIDIDSRWSDLGVSLGYQNQGNVHPTDAGHNDIGTLVASLL